MDEDDRDCEYCEPNELEPVVALKVKAQRHFTKQKQFGKHNISDCVMGGTTLFVCNWIDLKSSSWGPRGDSLHRKHNHRLSKCLQLVLFMVAQINQTEKSQQTFIVCSDHLLSGNLCGYV